MARIEITESEILEELSAAVRTMPPNPENTFTFWELMGATGLSRPALTIRLKTLSASGKLDCVRIYRTRLDGQEHPVPGYRIIRKATLLKAARHTDSLLKVRAGRGK